MRGRHSLIQTNFYSDKFDYTKPNLLERTLKKEKSYDDITTKTKAIISFFFEENYEYILIEHKDLFLSKIINDSIKILKSLFNENISILEKKIDKAKKDLELKYYSEYNFLKSEWKKFKKDEKKYKFLTRFRKHCIKTDDTAHHTCHNKNSKLIEINDDNKVSHVICIECKKCYSSKEILLFCNHCNLKYYSSILGRNENPNILPATWELYHCGGIVNSTMKCIKCQNIFYLNLKDNYLICLNKNCNFKVKPESIIWNCVVCKKDFKSKAKIYNPLEMEYIKKAIKKTLLFKERAYPSELPCCNSKVNELIFFHNENCKGEIYKGKLSGEDIIVCCKCKALNFYDKYIWTCPICFRKFRNYKSVWGKFFKKKEYLIPEKSSTNSKRRFNEINRSYNNDNYYDRNFNLNKNYLYNSLNSTRNSLEYSDTGIKKLITNLNVTNGGKKNKIYLMDILEKRNSTKSNFDRKRLLLSQELKHILNTTNENIKEPKEQDNINNTSTNETLSKKESRKIKKITINSNEPLEKDKRLSKGEIELLDNNKEKAVSRVKSFGKRLSKNYDEMTKEEIEKEELDKINDLEDDDIYLNLIIPKKQSNNYNYLKKRANDKLDLLFSQNKKRKNSDVSLGDLSSDSGNSNINLGNILTNPEKLNLIAKESIIPEFDTEDYEFLDPIGDGSFGKIYLVINKEDGSKYALKKIICNDLKDVKKFQKELELVYSKSHENIMKIISVEYKCLDITTYSIYILMELGLYDWNHEIKKREKTKNYYKEKEIIDILKQLSNALLFLENEGIAHRDIKPQNILIFENNKFKVSDFGEAKTTIDISQEATLKGSELFMSPMLYQGLKYNKKDVMHNPYKSDVYSLGLCLLYALTFNLNLLNDLREIISVRVFNSMISRALKKKYSEKLIKLITKMLILNEKERFSFEDIIKYINENYN